MRSQHLVATSAANFLIVIEISETLPVRSARYCAGPKARNFEETELTDLF